MDAHASPLLKSALPLVMRLARVIGLKLEGSIASLDGIYDSRTSQKLIFNRGMIPNIPENRRGRKGIKRGRKQIFDKDMYGNCLRSSHAVWGIQ